MGSTITIVEDHLDGFRGEACLVRDEVGNYFVVVTIGAETLAFRADEDGSILDWLEVTGGGDMTRLDVLESLALGEEYMLDGPHVEETTFDSAWYPDDQWEDWFREDTSLIHYDSGNWVPDYDNQRG